MRKPTVLDWIGATVLWFGASAMVGVFVTGGLDLPEELGVAVFLTVFAGGIAAARIRWLRRPEAGQVGLTTGEAQWTRLEELEARLVEMDAVHQRLAEVEERLDFSERLLVNAGQRTAREGRDA